MRLRQRWLVPVVVGMFMLMAASCGSTEPSGSQQPEPSPAPSPEGEPAPAQEPKVLTVAIPAEPPHLDPMDAPSLQHDLMYHIYRKLYAFTPDMKPEPDLVASEEISDDLRTWTLHLKEGVTFFDGTPVNAAAVKYTIERMLDPARAAPQAVLFQPIEEVRVVDEYTVQIVTAEPFASLRNNLAHPNAGIISPRADQELGDGFGRAPVSAGPYMVEEWVSGDRIVLTRFPDYQGPPPYYDRIVFRIIPAPETQLAMLERGEADVAIRVPVTLARAAENNPDLQVIRLDGTRLFYFWFNLDKPPLDDVEVRKALNLAVDRDALIEHVLLGAGSHARSVMEKIITFSTPVGELTYDPEQARRMLQQAGVLGQTLRIVTSEGNHPFDRQVGEALVGYLRDVGMDAQLDVIPDNAAYLEAMTRREHHMGLVGWAGSTADPDQYLRRQLWGQIAGEPWNFAGYKNPEVDRLIEEGASTFDNERRAEIYAEIQRLIWNDWPWLILYRATGFAVADADITGIEVYLNSQAHVYTRARPAAD